MPATLALCLSEAARDAGAAELATADPLRLQLPPEQVEDVELEPRTAALLGSLYLLSELESIGAVACAETLSQHRWSLGVVDPASTRALEEFAAAMPRRPDARARAMLYARLFGAPSDPEGPLGPGPAATPNHAFEELLAGYCQALLSVRERGARGTAGGLRRAGQRLRGNLAPRQYGNTMLVVGDLVTQARQALDLLALPGVRQLVAANDVWAVVRAMQPENPPDIGRHVDRGRAGRSVISSAAQPSVPDLVDSALADAAALWLDATGFALADPEG